jgi:hypothetical protein
MALKRPRFAVRWGQEKVIHSVSLKSDKDHPEIRDIGRPIGALCSELHVDNSNGRKNRDNGDNNQQLNESKALALSE